MVDLAEEFKSFEKRGDLVLQRLKEVADSELKEFADSLLIDEELLPIFQCAPCCRHYSCSLSRTVKCWGISSNLFGGNRNGRGMPYCVPLKERKNGLRGKGLFTGRNQPADLAQPGCPAL